MCVSGAMVGELGFRCGDSGSFPRRGRNESTSNSSEGSNEEIMGKEQKEAVLW